MRKIKYKIYWIFGVVLLLFSSCSDSFSESDMYDNNVRLESEGKKAAYSAWGFVTTTGEELYVKTDSGKLLKLANPTSFSRLKEGNRVFLQFSIADGNKFEKMNGATYDYVVQVSKLVVAAYDKLQVIGAKGSRAINWGYVKLKGVNISSHYLNVSVQFNKLNKQKCTFKLFYDQSRKEKSDGQITLDLVDSSSVLRQPTSEKGEGLLSFDISILEKLQKKNSEGKIRFSVVVNRDTDWEQRYNFVYEP